MLQDETLRLETSYVVQGYENALTQVRYKPMNEDSWWP